MTEFFMKQEGGEDCAVTSVRCIFGRKGVLRTHPMMTLNAPSGVTRIGGANVYAAKLATE